MNWICTQTPDRKPEDQDYKTNGKLNGKVKQFKPNFWEKYQWNLFESPFRYVQVLWYCIFILSVDCNNFFLKFILYVPPNHDLLKYRLVVWGFSAIPASKEYYEYMHNKYCYKFGPFIWLSTFTLLVEFSIMFKFGVHIFVQPFPWYVKYMWITIGAIFIAGGYYAYLNKKKRKENDEHEPDFNPFDPPVDVEFTER